MTDNTYCVESYEKIGWDGEPTYKNYWTEDYKDACKVFQDTVHAVMQNQFFFHSGYKAEVTLVGTKYKCAGIFAYGTFSTKLGDM